MEGHGAVCRNVHIRVLNSDVIEPFNASVRLLEKNFGVGRLKRGCKIIGGQGRPLEK